MQRNCRFHPVVLLLNSNAAKQLIPQCNETVGSTQKVLQLNSNATKQLVPPKRYCWRTQMKRNSWFHPKGTAAKLKWNETTSKQESPYQLRRNDSVESAYSDTDVKSSETMVCRLAGLLRWTPSSVSPKRYWRRPKSQEVREQRDYT